MEPTAENTVTVPLRNGEDVARLRIAVRKYLVALGLNLTDQTKMITAASELARNTVTHGGGGESRITRITDGSRRGVRLSFIDAGPGIADIDLALTKGYSSSGGLGLGLQGAKLLSDEFELKTEPGKGTAVAITKWKAP